MTETSSLDPAPPSDPAKKNPLLNLFFGKDTVVERGPLGVLMLVSLGIAFENYDIGLVNAALKQIAPDLQMTTGETGSVLGVVRMGGVGVLMLIPLADVLGRRRMFLMSLIGMSVGTFLTAFAQTALHFTLLQLATRAFMLTGAALSVVILVEEFPAEQRGSAIGLMGVLGGLGYGLGAGLYAAVDALPYGWRSLYALGVLPLAALPFLRRSLRETRRFEQHSRKTGVARISLASFIAPLAELAQTHPRRVIAIGLAGLFGAMGSISVFQYTSFFVQEAHGWAPGQYSLLVLGGGFIGQFGSVFGGRGSDRFGRRKVGFGLLLLAPLFAMAFFNGPEGLLVISWGLYVFCMSGADIVIRALSAELFPTSHRGSSGGALIAVQAIGFAAGLFLFAIGTELVGEPWRVVTWVSFASLGAAVCLLFLPETHRQELETLSGEAADA
jgi:MFS family permease